jgi:hypothetical protein
MTPTEHLIAFVAMAVAIVAILLIGTLAAADILPLGRRRRGGDTSAPSRHADLRPAPPSGDREEELVASAAGPWRADQ